MGRSEGRKGHMSSITVAIEIMLMFFVLVSIHEWGHFYFAKRAGILVREFAIGFGPKVFTFVKGETRYTLRLLPIGGFVRMAGEDPEMIQVNTGQTIALAVNNNNEVSHIYLDQLDQRRNVIAGVVSQIDLERKLMIDLEVDGEAVHYKVDPRAFMVARGKETQIAPWDRQFGSKSVGARALAIFMGPVMNFLLAAVLFFLFIIMAGVADGLHVKLNNVDSGKAAAKAGLKAGDIVLSVEGTEIGTDSSRLISLIKNAPGKPLTWVVQRGQEVKQFVVTADNVDGAGLVGVEIAPNLRRVTTVEAVKGTGKMMVNSTKEIMIGFKRLLFGQFKMEDLGGPVRIVEVTSEYARNGIDMLIGWTGLFSLYLGLFNLLPIPALDGSRLIFIGLEALRGKPIDPNRESMVHFIGFALLMLLMIAVTYNDILRLFKG